MPLGSIRLFALASLLITGSGHAHYVPMVNEGYPVPPPTIDPGPDASLLRVTIVDAGSGGQTSATVSVNGGDHEPDRNPYAAFGLRRMGNRHKGPIRFHKVPYYFYTDGRFDIRVPPGRASIVVGKGYEFLPKTVTLTVGKNDTTVVRISIERAIDMTSKGWYSGDTHIHIERTGTSDDTILVVTSAKDIRYSYLLSMNTKGYDRGGEEYESYFQRKGLGDRSVAKSGPLLFTKVAGRRPGELITLDAGTDTTTLVVDIDVVSSIYPVRYIEIIVNGRITDRHFSAEARTRWALQTHVDISETSWIAVRTYGDAGTEAHTNPVYVYVGGNRQFDNDSARNIIARLNGSIEHIEVKKVVANLNRLKDVLEQMLAGKPGSLPLPAIPE